MTSGGDSRSNSTKSARCIALSVQVKRKRLTANVLMVGEHVLDPLDDAVLLMLYAALPGASAPRAQGGGS